MQYPAHGAVYDGRIDIAAAVIFAGKNVYLSSNPNASICLYALPSLNNQIACLIELHRTDEARRLVGHHAQ